MILNLDPTFTVNFKYKENDPLDFESFYFAGGEFHVKLKQACVDVTIVNRIKSPEDIIEILIAADALRRTIRDCDLHLYIPYVPYARQDRINTMGESLSIKVFADLINSVGFNSVSFLDPHSDVTPALINNSLPINNTIFVRECIEEIFGSIMSHFFLISPDAGASKKTFKLGQDLSSPVVQGHKHRNVLNGKLDGFSVDKRDFGRLNCVIVDDICDGGGTFIGLAKELKKKNAGNLYLIVTHGIFSKGVAELSEYFDGIYSTNSFHDSLDGVKIKTIEI